ncbi:mycofactocin-coupled SDR family oxidoreductase [Nocardia harenae]|uniref:mycofactocin-coupled SDR family oxidoreductase n=1 Tax=Nocardia harenae TaxID=358707 RepID=UPI00083464A0|nr:mycofactocin-coupled SDR family oxidoreductase [Nocardia harenae]
MGRMTGKVALISGIARGQGRSHAITLAEQGADIIGFDICEDIPTNDYPLATLDDLRETIRLVEKTGRRIIAEKADARDRAAIGILLTDAMARFEHLDVVVANAGICPLGAGKPVSAFTDAVDVDLLGVINTVHAALPHLTPGGSVIITGSVAGILSGNGPSHGPQGPGGAGYSLSKRFLIDYTNTLALQLAPTKTRANAVHPTNCDTPLLHNAPMYHTFRPDLEAPTAEDALSGFQSMQAMPIPWVDPGDISNAVLFLASDESRYITGHHLTVDAGATTKRGL